MEKVAIKCEVEVALNLAETTKVDREATRPKGVKRSAELAQPTGEGERQGVMANHHEAPSTEVAVGENADLHHFWLLLKQAGYTDW